jgi:hypothetical protein
MASGIGSMLSMQPICCRNVTGKRESLVGKKEMDQPK